MVFMKIYSIYIYKQSIMYKPVLHNVVCLPRLSRYPEKMAKDPKRVWQGVKGECIIMFMKMMKMMMMMVMMSVDDDEC